MSSELWNRAAEAALCQLVGSLGEAMTTVGAYAAAGSAVTGGAGAGPAAVAIGAGAAANLVYGYGCSSDFDQPSTLPPSGPSTGCTEVDGCGWVYVRTAGGGLVFGEPFYDAKQISGVWTYINPDDVTETPNLAFSYVNCNGEPRTINQTGLAAEGATVFIEPRVGSTCISDDDKYADPGPFPPIEYTDADTNCTVNVQVLGLVNEGNGRVGAAVEVKPKLPPTKAAGGVIGGCNFGDTVVYLPPGGGGNDGGNGGGGPFNFPSPPPGDPANPIPPWVDVVKSVLRGAAGAATAAALDEFFEPVIPAGSYELKGVCELDPDGNPMDVTRSTNWPDAKAFDAVINRLDALADMFQFGKDLRQPICEREKPQLEGSWISTRWVSDGNSPVGGRPLRKLFRYRSKSARTESELRAYWDQLVWDAGPVCVRHTGAWWGNPQVWARSAEEGKRVLRFAATEAGINPDQTGEWEISGSRSPRYGVPGTMRLEKANGTLWVTRREGSDGR